VFVVVLLKVSTINAVKANVILSTWMSIAHKTS